MSSFGYLPIFCSPCFEWQGKNGLKDIEKKIVMYFMVLSSGVVERVQTGSRETLVNFSLIIRALTYRQYHRTIQAIHQYQNIDISTYRYILHASTSKPQKRK
jgi:LPS O-antigen subunit length determinant protein (WzzB/FepE family)